MAISDLKNRILALHVGSCVCGRYFMASPSLQPTKSTGCWQQNLRLQKKCKGENIKSYTKKILSLLNYRTFLFSCSSNVRGRISFPDLTQVTQNQHPTWRVPMSRTYEESEVFMAQIFSVRNLENQGGLWNKFLWFSLFFLVSSLCIKMKA